MVNFYRGVPASGRLAAATARVTHRGRRFVVAEGEVAGPDGRPALRLSVGAQVCGTRAGESAQRPSGGQCSHRAPGQRESGQSGPRQPQPSDPLSSVWMWQPAQKSV